MRGTDEVTEWTPRVRRITAPNVGEKGKLTFIRSLIGERRFDEAAEELEALLDANPRSYVGNIQMGRLLERNGRFDRATEHFETARAANPTQAEAPLLAGNAYLKLKDIDHAADSFETALALDSKLAAAHLGMAQVHFRRQEFEPAKSRLQQALAFDPQLQQARSLLARIHNRQGDGDATKREIEELLTSRPDQLRPTVALARVHLKDGSPAEAIALLESAAVQHDDNAQLFALLGRARMKVGNYAGAEEAFRRVLTIDPRRRELVPRLVDALIGQNKLAEARALLDKLPDIARRSGRVHAAYGKINLAAQHYKQAAEAFRAAILRRRDTEAPELLAAGGTAANGPAGALLTTDLTLPTGDVDWKSVAESYQAQLQAMRRPPEEASERRKSRAKQRRQTARAARA